MSRLLALCLLCFYSVISNAQDVDGSQDHPLISRYDGSEIYRYSQREYDEYRGVLGPAVGPYYDVEFQNEVSYEGRVTRILYRAPQGRSALEVFRNYQNAMTSNDFLELYSCGTDECGDAFYTRYSSVHDTVYATEVNNQRYMAARLTRPEGDVYAFLHVSDHVFMSSMAGAYAMLDIVEMEPMQSNMVTIDAAAMAEDITTTGRVALYGIYFDTDSAEIQNESSETMEQIATLLTDSPDLRVMVVGHTDNQGGIQYNVDLSHRRAQAVRDSLVDDYGIDVERLGAVGMGFFGPIASNRSEEGRALNRRVELVEY